MVSVQTTAVNRMMTALIPNRQVYLADCKPDPGQETEIKVVWKRVSKSSSLAKTDTVEEKRKRGRQKN